MVSDHQIEEFASSAVITRVMGICSSLMPRCWIPMAFHEWLLIVSSIAGRFKFKTCRAFSSSERIAPTSMELHACQSMISILNFKLWLTRRQRMSWTALIQRPRWPDFSASDHIRIVIRSPVRTTPLRTRCASSIEIVPTPRAFRIPLIVSFCFRRLDACIIETRSIVSRGRNGRIGYPMRYYRRVSSSSSSPTLLASVLIVVFSPKTDSIY